LDNERKGSSGCVGERSRSKVLAMSGQGSLRNDHAATRQVQHGKLNGRPKKFGFDHGVGHPLQLLCDAKVLKCRKNKAFKDLGDYSEWPHVADAVIKAKNFIENRS
jgi:hypothetical protein